MRDQQRDLAQQSHGFAEIGLMRSILRVGVVEPQQRNPGSQHVHRVQARLQAVYKTLY